MTRIRRRHTVHFPAWPRSVKIRARHIITASGANQLTTSLRQPGRTTRAERGCNLRLLFRQIMAGLRLRLVREMIRYIRLRHASTSFERMFIADRKSVGEGKSV